MDGIAAPIEAGLLAFRSSIMSHTRSLVGMHFCAVHFPAQMARCVKLLLWNRLGSKLRTCDAELEGRVSFTWWLYDTPTKESDLLLCRRLQGTPLS